MSEQPQRPGASGSGALLVPAIMLAASAFGGFILYRLTVPAGSSLHPIMSYRPAGPGGGAGQGPLTTSPQEPPHPVIPEQVPAIRLPGIDGRVHTLADWRGHPLLINFWATWCEPCRREIPLLRSLRRQRAAQGLEVIGVAIDSRAAVQQFMRRMSMDYPVLIGEDDGFAAISAFGMDTVLPFSVFADRRGRIVTLKVGELHEDEAELIMDRLRELDTGTATLAEVRKQISSGMHRLEVARAVRESS